MKAIQIPRSQSRTKKLCNNVSAMEGCAERKAQKSRASETNQIHRLGQTELGKWSFRKRIVRLFDFGRGLRLVTSASHVVGDGSIAAFVLLNDLFDGERGGPDAIEAEFVRLAHGTHKEPHLVVVVSGALLGIADDSSGSWASFGIENSVACGATLCECQQDLPRLQNASCTGQSAIASMIVNGLPSRSAAAGKHRHGRIYERPTRRGKRCATWSSHLWTVCRKCRHTRWHLAPKSLLRIAGLTSTWEEAGQVSGPEGRLALD